MTFLGIIIVVTVLMVLLAFVAKHLTDTMKNQFKYYLGSTKEKNGQFESIESSVLKHGFPLIKMTIFDKRYNFVLDTGATVNVLDSSVLINDIPAGENIDLKEGAGFMGAGDVSKRETQVCTLPMTYNKKLFSEKFQIANLSEMFDSIEKEEGIRIHGMLGSGFFKKHQWAIDFEKMVIWTGK